LDCVRDVLEGSDTKALPCHELMDPQFADDLRGVFDMSPALKHRWPSLRLCLEETRLTLAAQAFPPPDMPAPPPAAFAFEGLQEIRIGSCLALHKLPAEIGLCRSITGLVLISTGLTELPPEVGDLWRLEQLFLNGNFLRSIPAKVGALPSLQEFCADANLLETLPPFASPKLSLISAPGNRLRRLPTFAGQPSRLEVHGNFISDIEFGQKAWWSGLQTLKLMGNDLCELPQSLSSLRSLRTLSVAGNRLTALPPCVAQLGRLETILAYNNEIVELPERLLLGSAHLSTVLLEGNPISGASLASLVRAAEWTYARTVALDISQAREYMKWKCKDEPADAAMKDLPPCISVGDLIDTGSPCKYYLKLVRGSQLRREPGVQAAGLPGGPPPPTEKPARLLLAAFAASQGEPEWMGALRRLFTAPPATALPPPVGEVADVVDGREGDAQLAALWAAFGTPPTAEAMELPSAEDVDLLSVIDHRMRWYAEDAPALHRVLEALVAQHERSVFVGASMGGFGSLLHGGRLADAVLALGPQSQLDQAILRPPAADGAELRELSRRVAESVLEGRRRGAAMEVHCAADEHFWHGLNLPLAEGALTVHPLMPRKPFARLLDSVSLLGPILADVVHRAVQRPAAARGEALQEEPAEGLEQAVRRPAREALPQHMFLARWGRGGALLRHHTTRGELLQLFFRPGAPPLPRPGDWFCPRCRRRNMSKQFFCRACGVGVEGAHVAATDVIQVPGAREFPLPGDWGCGACGTAMASYEKACSKCGGGKKDHPLTLVAAA